MKLSVIVPVYNVEMYLAECLDSLLGQKDAAEAYEIVCVNDGSTDGCAAILERYARAHTAVSVMTQTNKGLSAARNAGLAAARGEYIWFVDSDDVADEHAVGELCRLAAEYGSPDKVLFDYIEFQDGALGECRGRQGETRVIAFASGSEMSASKQTPRWNIACNYLVKRSLLEQNRLRFVEGVFFEDEEFNFWLTRYTGACVYTSRAYYYYRKRAGSILCTFMGGGFAQYIDGRLRLAALHREMLLSYDAPDQAQMRAVVSKQELQAAVLYDVQGILVRLLIKGSAEYFERYLARLKAEGHYPYPTPWGNLIPRRSVKKTLVNWAALLFPREGVLRVMMATSKRFRRGREAG